jgi:hypothetical protein
LSAERMAELERRIFRMLKEGEPNADVTKVLDLSDRDAARVLNPVGHFKLPHLWPPKLPQAGP